MVFQPLCWLTGKSQCCLTSASRLIYIPVLFFAQLGVFKRKGRVYTDLFTKGSIFKCSISLCLGFFSKIKYINI